MSVLVEENQRFSQSRLWTAQRTYYDQEGIDAWSSEVPFYVTSNPFIAHCYAHIALRFIQDYIKQTPKALDEPFYFLELGTGPGQFSYYLIKALLDLKNRLKLSSLKLCYVMSDFTEKNIEFWRQHQKLQDYVEQGILDFAQLDLEQDCEIRLQARDIVLKEGSVKNPMIVVANYIFDTLRTDIFTIQNNKLFESLVTLNTPSSNCHNNQPKDWQKVDVKHVSVEVTKPYYNKAYYNDVLTTYLGHLNDTHFLFPIAALEALQRLKMVSNGKMLVLSSDKAYSSLEEQEALDYPELAFHGSFSVMANFDIIARVFKNAWGDAWLQTPREGITTAVFTSGVKFSQLPETSQALEEYVERFSPGDYFLLHDQIGRKNKEVKLEVYAALLAMSRWDPYVYELVNERMIELLEQVEVDVDTLEYLSSNLPKVADNFYFIPGCEDVLFIIGLFFHEAEKYEQAIPYYRQSLDIFDEQHVTVYNLALCYYELNQLSQALELFEQSLLLDPKQKEAKNWIKSIKKELKK